MGLEQSRKEALVDTSPGGAEECQHDRPCRLPQVLFEALISPDRRGYMGLDDILLLSYPCGESWARGGVRAVRAPCCRGRRPSSPRGYIPAAKAPHFFRLGDVEVNAGQNASFQCMAAGRAAEAEHFLLQVRRVGPWPKGVVGFFWTPALSTLSGAPPLHPQPGTERGCRIPQLIPIKGRATSFL